MVTNWSAMDPVRAERIPRRRLSDLARRAQRGWLAALVIFGVVAVGLIVAVQFLPAAYRSSAVLMITSREGDLALTTPVDAATRSALVDESVATLNSPAMAERIGAEFRRKAPDQAKAIAGQSGGQGLRDLVKARRRGESYLVDVEATTSTRQSARAIVEAAIEVYQARQLDQRLVSAAVDHPLAQPSAVAPPIDAAAIELARLETEKAGLLASPPPPAVSAVAPDTSAAHAALLEARGDAAAMKALLRSEVTLADVAALRASGVVERLGEPGASFATGLLEYEAALAAAKDDPAKTDDIKFHKYRILTAASQLQPGLDAKVARLDAAEKAAASGEPASASPPAQTPETIAHLKVLDLQIEAQRRLVEAAAVKTPVAAPTQVAVAAPRTVDMDVRVVSRPSPGAIAPWREPLLLDVAAVGIALLLALASLAFTMLASNTVMDPRDAVALTSAPLVAKVPRVTAAQLRGLPPSDRHPSNFPIENPASSFADAMRLALAGIRGRSGPPGSVCVAVAGAQAGDGATTISLALARTAAASGVRVLVIDTDFEGAGLTRAMNIEPAAGIEALLGGDRTLMDLVVEDDMTSVHLLPSTPSESSRGALSLTQLTVLKAALANAKSIYEMVIIDCQPHSSRARARSMARMADLALIVAAYDVTKRDALSGIARRVQQNGARVCGVVFNFMRDRTQREAFKFAGEDPILSTAGFLPPMEAKVAPEPRSLH